MSEYLNQYAIKQEALEPHTEIETIRLEKERHKRNNEESILKQAIDLLSQNRELTLEEKVILKKSEEIKAIKSKRLEQIRLARKIKAATATIEEIEATRLKNRERQRRSRQKRKVADTPEEIRDVKLTKLEQIMLARQRRAATYTIEEIEAIRLRNRERQRRSRQKRRVAETPEEIEALKMKNSDEIKQYGLEKRKKEEFILKRAIELRNQNQELSLEETNILRKYEEIKATKLKKKEQRRMHWQKREAANTIEVIEATRLKNRERQRRYRQKRKVADTPEEMKALEMKNLDEIKQYWQEKREKEESILNQAMNLPIKIEEMSLREIEISIKAKEIEAMRVNRLERYKHFRQNKREKEDLIIKKAMELLSNKHELFSLEDNEVVRKAEQIKAKRLKTKQFFITRRADASPEEVEAMRLKNLEQVKRSRQNRIALATPEELEVMKLKRFEQRRQYRQDKRKREELILRQATDLIRQNQEISSDEREVIRLANKVKADRLKTNEYVKQLRKKNAEGRMTIVQGCDEIKVEKEVLQETTIKAISLGPYLNPVAENQQEGYNDSSCSWLELSQKSFTTAKASKNHSYFQSYYGSSAKFDRRKLDLEELFRCMRVLINSTTKLDGLEMFGKQIAQKLRASKRNVAEVNVAKQLIDDILQNLAVGGYGLESKVVKVEN